MGCILSSTGEDHAVRLRNGTTRIALRNLQTMRVVNLCITSHTDLAVLLGSLAKNAHLQRLELPDRHINLSIILKEFGTALH